MREFQTFLNLIARCLWLISYLSFQISEYKIKNLITKKYPGLSSEIIKKEEPLNFLFLMSI